MAGDWIAVRTDLHEDPAVLGISAFVSLDEFAVVGRLLKLWAWANLQTANGQLPHASAEWIDRFVFCPDFAVAMQDVGWLSLRSGAVEIPKFERWNSESAKARLGEVIRKRMARKRMGHKKCPDKCPDKRADLSGPEKREERREKRVNTTPLTPPTGGTSAEPTLGPKEFLDAWNNVPGFVRARKLEGTRLRHFRTRTKSADWSRDWRLALDKAARIPFCLGNNDRSWVATVDWFLRPGTVTKILEGAYDRLGGASKPAESPEKKAERHRLDKERAERDRANVAPAEERRRLLDQMKGSIGAPPKAEGEP